MQNRMAQFCRSAVAGLVRGLKGSSALGSRRDQKTFSAAFREVPHNATFWCEESVLRD
jgi:hypothetical protein